MKLTEAKLKKMILEVLEGEDTLRKAKEALFAKLVEKGYADPKMGHSADEVSAEEVEEGSKDYEDFKEVGLLVTIDGKHYVGEY